MRLAEDYHESSPNEAIYYYKNALLALYCYIKLNPLLTRESHLLYSLLKLCIIIIIDIEIIEIYFFLFIADRFTRMTIISK